MVFSSLIFIFYFLPLFLVAYYATPARNAVLLVGSAVFYTWGDGRYVPVLLLLVYLNYWAARYLDHASARARPIVFALVTIANILNLCFFKYADFLILQLNALTGLDVPLLGITLPLGISFFTFQLLSYLVDVFNRRIRHEPSLVSFATYIMMFPHLIAGPIVRYADIAHELKQRRLQIDGMGLGLQYFVVGLSQKVLIANTVAPLADALFLSPAVNVTTLTAWLGISAYTLQIYFDFCGYSNMAIGLAFMLGFHFPRNFNYPYSSRSITEFWRRWHISLSSWFRDYVYIPLGGNRHGSVRTLRNLLIVFFLTGLWHGAAWTFVIWGMFHGLFLVIERVGLGRLLSRLPTAVGHAYTMLVVMTGWIFFRADNLDQALVVVRAMFGMHDGYLAVPLQPMLTVEVVTAMVLGAICMVPFVPWLFDRLGKARIADTMRYSGPNADTLDVHVMPVWMLAFAFLLSSALLATSTLNPFLYFRF